MPRVRSFMRRLRHPVALLLPLAGLFLAANAASPRASAPPMADDPVGTEFFEKSVRPLLSAKCLTCHSGPSASDGLSLESRADWLRGGKRGPAVVPGKPEASLLLKAVHQTDPNLAMPPGSKLTDEQIAVLSRWIAIGTPGPKAAAGGGASHLTGMTDKARAHWSFQPIYKPAIPAVKNRAWVRNPVDAFVLAKLEKSGMKPNPPATREALIRRATYDLTGLPPTVEEVRAFVIDRSPDAWPKVVDRLLASPRYGERWARHWLDSARYSDTRGLVNNAGKNGIEDYRYPDAWTYRDYVIKSINEDKPYNQFLTEQIAADRLPGIAPNDARLAALGFLTVGKRFASNDDLIDERIDTITKATMGLTVSCARCHDHKFDPVPQTDYYALHGILASTIEPDERPEIGGMTTAAPSRGPEIDEYRQKMAAIESKGRSVLYAVIGEKLDTFQKNAEGYLMLATTRPKSPDYRALAEKYDIYPPDLEVAAAVRPRPNDPVLTPFFALSRLPADGWAERAARLIPAMLHNRRLTVNTRVAEALINLHPKSIADVTHAYAALFADAQKQTASVIAARSAALQTAGMYPAGVDAAQLQLIETPYPIPAASEVDTIDRLRTYVEKLPLRVNGGGSVNRFPFAEANELKLTAPGAPGHAMLVADAPSPRDSFVYLRGDKNRPGPLAPRRFLTVLSSPNSAPFTSGSGRLELARAITAPNNPLTPRVLVNRVWMNHFGDGFVRTPDDLGNQCESPSHPALMDWLSTYFVENGWSLKRLSRLIMLSNTYQESSRPNPAYQVEDPDNRLLWRANLRKLDFESIRDSLVLLTGRMDTTIGGKPVNLTDEPYSYRRSVYGYVDRLFLSDLMTQFDFADPDAPNSHRISTIVPQQALFFMNSPMAVDVARQVTARPEVADAPSDAARVRALYHVLFQRDPRPDEVTLAEQFVGAADRLAAARATRPAARRAEQQADRRAATQATARRKRVQTNKYAVIQNDGATVTRAPLTPWQLYAQALLCSNEFVYVN